MVEVVVPIVAILTPVLIVAIVSFSRLWTQTMHHRERMAMIEKGIAPEDIKPEQIASVASSTPVDSREKTLATGITTTLIGLALTIGLGTMGFGPYILGGLIPMAVGLGQIIYYVLTSKESDEGKNGN